MGQLEHPNIVPVYDFGEDQESATRYFTMKLVKGKTLTDMLRDDERNHGTGDFYYKFLSIYSKVCDALAFAHNKRVVHRDLKPDNIMIGSFGEVYLMDWGIARVLGPKAQANGETVEAVQVRKDANIADLDAEGQVIGTFYYMAPEQAHAQLSKVDERTDIFLMGAVLYELLTGIPPYFAPTPIETVMQAQACEVRAPEIMAPERNIPSALSRICMKCMAKDQNDRYQDAMELKRDVENFIRGGAAFPAITFEAGQHLMYEGEIGGQVFIINKGTAQVYKTGKDGRKQGLATLGVGSVVGEASVLSSKPRSASVVAVEDVIATAVTREQLEKELGVDSWMGALVKALANRFIDVDTRLDEAKVRMTAASLMNWLLQYLLLYGRSGPEGQREVGWTHLLTATMAQFKKSEEEVRIGVAELKSFKFDTTRDTIWFAPG
jgi:serine/threonine-protein kinase